MSKPIVRFSFYLAAIALGTALAFALPSHARAEIARADAIKLLSSAVVELRLGTRTICTAAKVGPTRYLTAGHCGSILSEKFELKHGYTYQWPVSVTVGLGKKDDWAVLNVASDRAEIGALELGCDEEIYLGMPVAYMGFPIPNGRTFAAGQVMSTDPPRDDAYDADFIVDLPASHGASGSPIISLDTGRVVGILIEGIIGGAGFFAVGVQSIRDTPLCPAPINVAQTWTP